MSLPLGPRKKSRPTKEPGIVMPVRAEAKTSLIDLMILRDSLDNVGEIKPTDEPPDVAWSWMTFWSYTGPGFLIAIAYLDPGNLEADLQAGAYTKYQLTWVFLITTIIGLFLQAMGARIGIVTGKHLAELCREEYSRSKSIGLWIMSEVAIIASDVQAVVCSAIALKILFNIPLWQGCIITALDTFTFLMLHIFGIRSLEFFFVILVGVMASCFFWNFTLNPPEATEVLHGIFVPTMPSYGLRTAVGIVGSIILPQNYYVHSAVVLSRDVDRSNPAKVREANKYLFADAALALSIAFIINLAVVGCFAELFFNKECASSSTVSACVDVDTVKYHHEIYGNCTISGQTGKCQQIGLKDADIALQTALGATASLIWALGLLASGQSSTMTITYAGQFITEGFGGFMLPVHYRVLICRLVSIVPALAAALMEATNPAIMDELTQWGNIITSCCVPFAVLPMLKFCSSPKLMGEHILNINISRGMWMVSWALIVVNLLVIWETLFTFQTHISKLGTIIVVVIVSFLYIYFSYLMVEEEISEVLQSIYRSICKSSLPRTKDALSSKHQPQDDSENPNASLLYHISKCTNFSGLGSSDDHDNHMDNSQRSDGDGWNGSDGKLLVHSQRSIGTVNTVSSTMPMLNGQNSYKNGVKSVDSPIYSYPSSPISSADSNLNGVEHVDNGEYVLDVSPTGLSDRYGTDPNRSILPSTPPHLRM